MAADRSQAQIQNQGGKDTFPGDPEGEFVVRDAKVNYRTTKKQPDFQFSPDPSRLEQIQAQIAAFQQEIAEMLAPAQAAIARYPMADLLAHLAAIGKYPLSEEDGRLTPAELLRKYPPPIPEK